jgi:hypothetical protein
LKSKDEEFKDMKDKVLHNYAEMENVLATTSVSQRTPKGMPYRFAHHIYSFDLYVFIVQGFDNIWLSLETCSYLTALGSPYISTSLIHNHCLLCCYSLDN